MAKTSVMIGVRCLLIIPRGGSPPRSPRHNCLETLRLGNRGQVAGAASIGHKPPQGKPQQVRGGDHLRQAGGEGGAGTEPIGPLSVALEDHLNPAAVDLNVGDGAGLGGGEGAEDGSGCGGHRSALRLTC